MKKIFILITSFVIVLSANAQFVESPTGTLTTTDKVGIGTSTPSAKLDITGTSLTSLGWGSSTGLYLRGNGGVSGKDWTAIRFEGTDGDGIIRLAESEQNRGLQFGVNNSLGDNLIVGLAINGNGNVGIGTNSPSASLDVLGKSLTQLGWASSTGLYLRGNGSVSGKDWTAIRFEGTDGDGIIRLAESEQNRGLQFGVNNSLGDNLIVGLAINGNGNVGIGTNSPLNVLDLRLSSNKGYTARFAEENGAGIILGVNPNNDDPLSGFIGHTSSNRNIEYAVYGTGKHVFNTNAGQSLIIHNSGNVGIGTSITGSHKLAVEGSIGAREIKVEASGWSDFVFENTFQLRTLEEVEQHINENGHLPEIPSESEVIENGINLGEMNAKLLQKIEELTLYLIEQNKEIKELKVKVNRLEDE